MPWTEDIAKPCLDFWNIELSRAIYFATIEDWPTFLKFLSSEIFFDLFFSLNGISYSSFCTTTMKSTYLCCCIYVVLLCICLFSTRHLAKIISVSWSSTTVNEAQQVLLELGNWVDHKDNKYFLNHTQEIESDQMVALSLGFFGHSFKHYR